jgi:molybdenum cofactor synthesis domain-containing protein
VDASVVVVGNELLSGHTEDANGPFLAEQMRELGHRVRRITVVPDDEHEIVSALRDAKARAGLVFVCGGLGPTADDVTIDAVAAFLERPLHEPEPAREQIHRIYRKGHKRDLIDSPDVDDDAWRMARVPEGATVVRNDEGAAPGSVHTVADTRLYVLPGPPAELQSVVHHLRRRDLIPVEDAMTEIEVELDTFEAPVSSELDTLDRENPDVEIGSYPQHGERRVVVRLRGEPEAVEDAHEALNEALGDIVIDGA